MGGTNVDGLDHPPSHHPSRTFRLSGPGSTAPPQRSDEYHPGRIGLALAGGFPTLLPDIDTAPLQLENSASPLPTPGRRSSTFVRSTRRTPGRTVAVPHQTSTRLRRSEPRRGGAAAPAPLLAVRRAEVVEPCTSAHCGVEVVSPGACDTVLPMSGDSSGEGRPEGLPAPHTAARWHLSHVIHSGEEPKHHSFYAKPKFGNVIRRRGLRERPSSTRAPTPSRAVIGAVVTHCPIDRHTAVK